MKSLLNLVGDLAEVCLLESDCSCNAATGKCESLLAITDAPVAKPSANPSSSSAPSAVTTGQPTKTGGLLSLCTDKDLLGLELGCTCVTALSGKWIASALCYICWLS